MLHTILISEHKNQFEALINSDQILKVYPKSTGGCSIFLTDKDIVSTPWNLERLTEALHPYEIKDLAPAVLRNQVYTTNNNVQPILLNEVEGKSTPTETLTPPSAPLPDAMTFGEKMKLVKAAKANGKTTTSNI